MNALRSRKPAQVRVTGRNIEVSAIGQTKRGSRMLLGLLLFNGLGAVGGGLAMLAGELGLPLDLLEGTPFPDYTIPAWILIVVVGGSALAAAWGVWKIWARASEASILAGLALLGWIVTEFVMIPEAWIPQAAYFLLSLTIIWLGWRRTVETGAST